MATANLKPSTPVRERFVNVSALSQPRPVRSVEELYLPRDDLPPAPWIRLAGRWLEQAGFAIDSRVRIQIEEGKLIITPA